TQEWSHHFRSWDAANGLRTKIGAFVLGASKFISGVGISNEVSQTIIVVLIISFAATSLDTACRIQRYIISEVGSSLKIKALGNRYLSSALAIFSALLLMMSANGGKGGLSLWPLFGATNQMLAGITLILVVVYLKKQNRNIWPYLIPAIFVIVITFVGLFINLKLFFQNNKLLLGSVALILFVSQCFVIAEAIWSWKSFLRNKKIRT
ncbi:MAG: carbon starvation CstA family protein, partial [Bacteriovoracaceae bacterium]